MLWSPCSHLAAPPFNPRGGAGGSLAMAMANFSPIPIPTKGARRQHPGRRRGMPAQHQPWVRWSCCHSGLSCTCTKPCPWPWSSAQAWWRAQGHEVSTCTTSSSLKAGIQPRLQTAARPALWSLPPPRAQCKERMLEEGSRATPSLPNRRAFAIYFVPKGICNRSFGIFWHFTDISSRLFVARVWLSLETLMF